MTQSIIVYRNPAEQAFWESGLIGPLLCGLLVFFVILMVGEKILLKSKMSRFSRKYRYAINSIVVLASVAGISTIVLMV